jgi:hypothetical protein
MDGWTGGGRSRIFLIKNSQTLLSIKNKHIVPSPFSDASFLLFLRGIGSRYDEIIGRTANQIPDSNSADNT